MALYAIGDLHLSLGTDKPMDVFGGAWKNYLQKLERGLSCILEVDGGVGPATFQTCLDHGADLLVAGSAYFRAPDRDAFVKLLQADRKELP